jgi:hypothetical protein
MKKKVIVDPDKKKNRIIKSVNLSNFYSILRILILGLTLSFTAHYVYALDYPHSGINNISCDSCHFVYGGEPSLLPPWTAHTPQDIDDTQYNTLCWSCHNDIDAPYVRTHSSLQIDNSYGDWTIECRVCHDPHTQKQVRIYGSESYVYEGVVTSITATTLTESGANWVEDEYRQSQGKFQSFGPLFFHSGVLTRKSGNLTSSNAPESII